MVVSLAEVFSSFLQLEIKNTIMMTSNARMIAIITRGENGPDAVRFDGDEELRVALTLPDELRTEDCDARRVLVERCTGRAFRFASVSREPALRYEDLFREFA